MGRELLLGAGAVGSSSMLGGHQLGRAAIRSSIQHLPQPVKLGAAASSARARLPARPDSAGWRWPLAPGAAPPSPEQGRELADWSQRAGAALFEAPLGGSLVRRPDPGLALCPHGMADARRATDQLTAVAARLTSYFHSSS